MTAFFRLLGVGFLTLVSNAGAHPGLSGHVGVLGDDKGGQSASIALRLDQLAKATDKNAARKLATDIRAAWVDRESDAVDLLMHRGIEASQRGETSLARDMFDRVILVAPHYAEGWFRRSQEFSRNESFVEAIFDLEQALKYEPRHFPAWMRLGEIFELIGEKEAALDAYRRTLDIHPFVERAKRGRDRLIPLVEGRSL